MGQEQSLLDLEQSRTERPHPEQPLPDQPRIISPFNFCNVAGQPVQNTIRLAQWGDWQRGGDRARGTNGSASVRIHPFDLGFEHCNTLICGLTLLLG
jgi:hypothetical protein